MNAMTDAKIRFSDAIEAVEITPKTLRGWMAHDRFEVFTPKAPGAWAAFTAADIALLSIMRELIAHGVGIADANMIARDVLISRLGPLIRSKNMPAHALEAVMIGHRLIVVREADDWRFAILSDDDAEPDAPAYLVVDLEAVVSTAINRAPVTEGAS